MTVARSRAIVAGVAAVTTVALPPGFDTQSSTTVTNIESYYVARTSGGKNIVVSSQAMMAAARRVDLSAASAGLWLSATTLLALLAGRLLDRTPSAALPRRNERAYTGLRFLR